MADLIQTTHPANQTFLAYLKSKSAGAVLSQSPEQVDTWGLGTHPDLVDYLWQTIALPKPCAWVTYQRPVLVHPDSGVIFAVAGGTSTLALRLPDAEKAKAFKIENYGASYSYGGSTIYAKDFGDYWALVPPFDKRVPAWCLSAYEHAATLSN